MSAPPMRRSRGRPLATSIAEIVAHATELTRHDGPEHLTMRALAESLGVSPMTIYTYFADREAVLDAVAEAYLSTVPIPVPSGDWRADLRRLARADWSRAQAEPRLARLAITRADRIEPPTWLSEDVVDIVTEGGLTRREAAVALSILATYLLGAFGRWASQGEDDPDHEFEVGLDVVLSGLSVRFGMPT